MTNDIRNKNGKSKIWEVYVRKGEGFFQAIARHRRKHPEYKGGLEVIYGQA
ncbi:MAG: hypothetical protein JKY17_08965 [Magnetovibrio sp.]|nr:hypothetical protein [Magnetovibrio sp.]